MHTTVLNFKKHLQSWTYPFRWWFSIEPQFLILKFVNCNLAPIQLISISHCQKYWFMQKGHSTIGWNPTTNAYETVQTDKVPPDQEILRHFSYEPEKKLINLPLSIYKLLRFWESIGATEVCMTTMILQYLKTFKETNLDSINTKKTSLGSIIHQLTYHCCTQLATFPSSY